MEFLTLPDPELPVTFRSTDGTVTKVFNRRPDAKGGEGYVWRDGDYAWKIFTNDNTFPQKLRDYNRAKDAGLPMGGNPNVLPKLMQGGVTLGAGRVRNGFAIQSKWLAGTGFFGKTSGSLTSALQKEAISHSRSNGAYLRIKRGINTANSLPLTDVQGFVDGKATAADPVAFLDIHIGTPSGAAGLVAEIDAWGSLP